MEKLFASVRLRIISTLIFFVGNILFGNILNIRISVYHLNFGNFVYFYISAITGIMFIISVSYSIQESRILGFYGQNSLLMLATQYFAFNVYGFIGSKIFNYNFMQIESLVIPIIVTLVTLLFYIPAAWIFNSYLPVVVGKRKIKIKKEKISINM